MEIGKLIEERRTIHKYKLDKVSEVILREAIRVAQFAPNHKLTFPWKFIELGPKALIKVGELAVNLKSKAAPISESEANDLRKKYATAPHILVVVQSRSADLARAKEDYASISMVLQNLGLILWNQGIGSKWSTGAITTTGELFEICQLDPAESEIVGFFWIGYPAQVPPIRERPQLAQVLSSVP